MASKTRERKGPKPPASSKIIRTTLVLPDTLDRNLEVWCTMNGCSKAEAVKAALHSFLSDRGMDPDKHPRLHVAY
jgi:hypothetical protein